MICREDLVRIENASDRFFLAGKFIGDWIKKHLHISFRIFIVIGGIVIFGSLFFVAGIFSSRKKNNLLAQIS